MSMQIQEKPTRSTGGERLRPRVDIVERPAAFVIHVSLPGVAEENLSVTVTRDLLTVEATMDELTPAGRQIYREYRAGTYFRQFALSDLVDQEQIGASLAHGLLTLTLPKAAAAQPRRIDVATV